MCGIAGIISHSPNPLICENTIQLMGEPLKYRGPDQDGFVVSVDDWKSLSKSIVALAEDDQKLKEYQSLARQRVVDSFSIEVMVHSLEKLYLAQII